MSALDVEPTTTPPGYDKERIVHVVAEFPLALCGWRLKRVLGEWEEGHNLCVVCHDLWHQGYGPQ